MKAYEDCFEHCNNPKWVIVPADQNWYKEYMVASAMVETLTKLNMQYPIADRSRVNILNSDD